MSPDSTLRIGVLAVQGAFAEHVSALHAVGAAPREVRHVADLDGLDGLVIPGGESTTLSLIAGDSGLLPAIRAGIDAGLPVFGTCAGMIMLARETVAGAQPLVGGVDICVRRNAYGRQRASFEAAVSVPVLGTEAFPAIFIRAPWIEAAGPEVEVLAEHSGRIVAAQHDRIFVTAFHPELTSDLRLHRYFVDDLVSSGRSPQAGAEGRTYVRSQ